MELTDLQLTWIAYLFGAMIVLQFCTTFFNDPAYHHEDTELSEGIVDQQFLAPTLPKYMTNRANYICALIAFSIVGLGIYTGLAFLLPVLYGLGVSNEAASAAESGSMADDFLLSALIVAGLAPNTIGIRKLLKQAKQGLHDIASIPAKGRDTYQRLKSQHIVFDPGIIGESLGDEDHFAFGEPRRFDLQAEDFQAPRGSIERTWARISYLMTTAKRWAQTRPYSRNIRQKELRWSGLESVYKELRGEMTAYREGDEDPNRGERLLERFQSFALHLDRMLACLLHMSEGNDKAIDQRLEDIGLMRPIPDYITIRWQQLIIGLVGILVAVAAASGLMVLAATLFSGNSFVEGSDKISTHAVLRTMYYAMPFHGMAVLVVLLAKLAGSRSGLWPAVNPWEANVRFAHRPWHIYLTLALVAYLFSLAILLLLQIPTGRLTLADLTDITKTETTFYWASLAVVTALFTAYRIDLVYLKVKYRNHLVRWLIRLGRASFQGAVLAGITAFIYLHLNNGGLFDLDRLAAEDYSRSLTPADDPIGMNRVAELLLYVVMTFLIGVALSLSSKFWSINDRRDARRVDLEQSIDVRFTTERMNAQASLRNLSKGGACIAGIEAVLPLGAPLELSGEGFPKIEGRVRGQKGDEIRVWFNKNQSSADDLSAYLDEQTAEAA